MKTEAQHRQLFARLSTVMPFSFNENGYVATFTTPLSAIERRVIWNQFLLVDTIETPTGCYQRPSPYFMEDGGRVDCKLNDIRDAVRNLCAGRPTELCT